MRPTDRKADEVRAQAARWFARSRADALDAAGRADLDAWLREDPRHRYEFQALESIWQAAAQVPADRLRALAEPPGHRPARRQALALGACALALGLGVVVWRSLPGEPLIEYRTAAGERREVSLPDGSLAQLNSRSHLRLRFDAHHRKVELLAGEAMFSVVKDASRPFSVDAGAGTATVTGTRFDVRRDGQALRVAVESGSVSVAGKHDDRAVALGPGQAASVDPQGRVGAVEPAGLETTLAWRSGQIVFTDTDLRAALREVSRYREHAVVPAADPRLATMRLSSVFRIDDTEAFLRALPRILPVELRTLADGRVEVVPR
ncbi:FecR family protein [Bordetella genomosp. 12]|uniref:Iron dicitrate transport regulator FecR n=1 Tax=Bordetella genomosp. 12 TaxID=463035 RepID=A0A261VUR7_9BORD|nr:FecR domain-containing protein [Bordetella genomosp. 12]OZI77835.1 iron dicitrate transport regulator FecR [Bordetella genomosp. 12]